MSDQPKLSLAHQRIRAVICNDLARGQRCNHHEIKAERLYNEVLKAQKLEREREQQAALDRVVERVRGARRAA